MENKNLFIQNILKVGFTKSTFKQFDYEYKINDIILYIKINNDMKILYINSLFDEQIIRLKENIDIIFILEFIKMFNR